ncbi:MAG: hypothetical protein QOD78_1219 [Chloroflexota bacterium]|nr:hypothetical protein [Chloroflexota bacterium]MEA2612274.1 hypothetical protein [Chloroflexota bacterium]
MTRHLAVAIVAVAVVWSLIGCSSLAPALPCEIAIVALPADTTMIPGDALPPGSQVLIAPDDFDRAATSIGRDSMNNPAVNLELRGDAVGRFGAHTAGHMGDRMAIAINGNVIAIPVIQAAISDGKMQIIGEPDGTDLVQQFAGCVRGASARSFAFRPA